MALGGKPPESDESVLKCAVDDLPVCILSSDAQGLVDEANKEAVQLFGDDVIGRHASRVYSRVEGIESYSPSGVRRALATSESGILREAVVAVVEATGARRLMASTFFRRDDGGVTGVLLPLSLSRLPVRLDPIQRLARGDDSQRVLQTVVDQALELLGGESAFLRTLSADGNSLELVAGAGSKLVREDALSPRTGLLGEIFTASAPRRIELASHCRSDGKSEESPLFAILAPVHATAPLGDNADDQLPAAVLGVVSSAQPFMSHHDGILAHLSGTVGLVLTWKRFISDMKDGYNAVMAYHVDAAGTEMIHNAKNLLSDATTKLGQIERQLRAKTFTGRFADMVRVASFDLKNMHVVLRRSLPKGQRADDDAESNINLSTAIRSAVNLVAGREGVDVVFKDSDDEIEVHARLSVLLFVFYNLLNNAVRAIRTQQHGSEVSIALSIHPSTPNLARVTVRDDGPGIPNEVLEDIRSGRRVSRRPGGTGLGLLSVMDAVINELGGAFDITSRLFHGTTCYVDLPEYKR